MPRRHERQERHDFPLMGSARATELNPRGPHLKSMDAGEYSNPVITFELQQVTRYLSVAHPGILLKTATRLILEVASAAHFLGCPRILEQFASWLQGATVFDDDAGVAGGPVD